MSLQNRQASGVRRSFTMSEKTISEARGPILIKFNVNHHWVRKLTSRLYQNCCPTATDSPHRLTIKVQSFYTLYEAMFGSPHYKLCQSCPWGQICPRPGIDSLHRLTIGKSLSINISKASGWILIKLHTQHHWQ